MAKEKNPGLFKLPFKLPAFHFGAKEEKPKKTAPQLKLVFFIVDWSKTPAISRVLEEERTRFHFIFKGKGTASSEVLDLLGLGASDKAVMIAVEQAVLVPVLYREVQKKLGYSRSGAGIAFTVPLSGINTPLLRVFKDSVNKNEKIVIHKEGEAMADENRAAESTAIHNDLIFAVINHGYSDEFMTVAREAGAEGGTVISARGLAHQGPVKFFGVSVQDEKEIVFVLATREKKLPIMEAVSRSCGITSKAEGLIFSLPVDSVMGLNLL